MKEAFLYFRYWLSTTIIEFGIRILPDDYTRSRMAMGIQWAADLINRELQIEEEYHSGEMGDDPSNPIDRQ